MKLTKTSLAVFAAAFFFCSCASLPKIHCDSTKRIPVTIIKDSTAPITQYVPYCDTVRIITPIKKKAQKSADVLIPDVSGN